MWKVEKGEKKEIWEMDKYLNNWIVAEKKEEKNKASILVTLQNGFW